MLSQEFLKQIKQSNVCVDAEKTKARMKEEFSAAPKDIKAAITAQTTQNRNTIYRAQDTGRASGRIVLAFAEILNITPYYFTGAVDSKDPCTDELTAKFLKEHGYGKLLKGKRNPIKKVPKVKEVPVPQEKGRELKPAVAGEIHPTVFRVTINDSGKMRGMVDELDYDGAARLLEALFIRAKAGGNAEQLCEIVKYCLLA
ncbi:MAG: hypothetical protein FWG36_07195 [Oscillospiraceae bacterium]|nr:hypothetical protein [Oscillospiraceae bacterium]